MIFYDLQCHTLTIIFYYYIVTKIIKIQSYESNFENKSNDKIFTMQILIYIFINSWSNITEFDNKSQTRPIFLGRKEYHFSQINIGLVRYSSSMIRITHFGFGSGIDWVIRFG